MFHVFLVQNTNLTMTIQIDSNKHKKRANLCYLFVKNMLKIERKKKMCYMGQCKNNI